LVKFYIPGRREGRGLPQEAIFFQLPQTPLEKWEDLVLSFFKDMY